MASLLLLLVVSSLSLALAVVPERLEAASLSAGSGELALTLGGIELPRVAWLGSRVRLRHEERGPTRIF